MTPNTRTIIALAVLLVSFNRVHGQDLPNPSDCVGKVDKFPNCDSVNSISKKCSNLSKQETIDCFCTQDLLNAYQGYVQGLVSRLKMLTNLSRCKGEIRQCVLSNSFDSAIDDEIANWLEACSPYLPSDITTPSVAQPTRTLNGDTCQTFIESCAHLSQSITSCSSAYTKPADITSCRCQSSLVSLASVCNLDGPESCIGTTAAMSDIWELQHCAAATQAFPTSKVRILNPLSCFHGTYH